jgi:hypothetical protein
MSREDARVSPPSGMEWGSDGLVEDDVAAAVPWNKDQKLRPISQQGREDFLAGLAQGLTVRHAAERAGRAHPRRFYELRAEDEEFARAWHEALEQGTQLLEEELRRRAVEGWEKTLEEWRDGKLVRSTTTRRYSPALLIFMLKARRPDMYRDNAVVRVTGHDGGPVQIEGYSPPTLADVVRLASELGVLDTIEGEAVAEAPFELGAGEESRRA